MFDNKFLLPFSPEQPDFFLIPGDKKVTVVWRPSATETIRAGGGDPYYEVAQNSASPLYDPNFRQYDVEGYRVYRGRSQSAMELVAEFDYAGTVLRDYTGAMAYPGRCAPELGILDDCPAGFPAPPALPDPGTYVDFPIAGTIVQVPLGGRFEKADGTIYFASTDTAVSGGGHDDRSLTDGGVPFAFVDNGLVNSFGYFYAVTAYDVNSFRSGPSSLESPMTTIKSVTPRAEAGDDGRHLDPRRCCCQRAAPHSIQVRRFRRSTPRRGFSPDRCLPPTASKPRSPCSPTSWSLGVP